MTRSDPHMGSHGGQDDETRVKICRDAVIMPPNSPRYIQQAGVLNSDGSFEQLGATWRFGRQLTTAPDAPDRIGRELAGRWLWAGVLFDHFGHFLVESFSRLWGGHAYGPIDGICYTPKRPRRGGDLLGFQRSLLDAFGLPQPVEIIRTPTRVEQLIVPHQGIGLGGGIGGGTEPMRAAIRDHFARAITPEGPEAIYVSRSEIVDSTSAIVGETELERLLVAEGYTVYHPQNDPIDTQIARYKAAKRLIFADGSTAHLFAYVARPDQRVAYLPRRSFWTDGPIDHIRGFGQCDVTVADTIEQEWLPAQKRKDLHGASFVQHDFEKLSRLLKTAGFISGENPWPRLSADATRDFLRDKDLLDFFALNR